MPLLTLYAVKHHHKMLASNKVSLLLVIEELKPQLVIQSSYANDIWIMFSLVENKSNGIIEGWFCRLQLVIDYIMDCYK